MIEDLPDDRWALDHGDHLHTPQAGSAPPFPPALLARPLTGVFPSSYGSGSVLGGTAFVEQLRREIEAALPPRAPRLTREALMGRVCRHVGIAPEVLLGGGGSSQVTRARAGIAYLWVEVLGHAGRPLAASLGVRPQSVYRSAMRGREEGNEWRRLLVK